MPECTPGALLDLAKCFGCLTTQQLAAVKTYLLAVQAGGSTEPGVLMDAARCFNCLTEQQLTAIQTNLLCQIANSGSPGACANLEGADSPLNVVTPDFVGQVYVQADGTVWQAGSLLPGSWVVICSTGGGEGLVFGADSDVVSAINGGADAFTLALDPLIPSGTTNPYTTLSFGNPVTVTGNAVFTSSPNLTSLELRLLATVGGEFNASDCAALLIIALPELLTVVDFFAGSCPSLLTLSLPVLATVGGEFGISLNSSITTLSLPALVSLTGDLNVAQCTSLTTISMPLATTLAANIVADGCTVLTSFSAPLWVPTDGTTINFNGDALDIPSVELILRRCVLAGVTTCTIDLSGGTNAGTASLGAQGQADVATLGLQVTMNP